MEMGVVEVWRPMVVVFVFFVTAPSREMRI